MSSRTLLAVESAAARGLPEPVRAALCAQNGVLAATPARHQHLQALGRSDVAAVVTGQQVGLFGGPLYAVHKAASAICLAQRLAAESGRPVVPIFWLQTEDHDLAEIAVSHACDVDGGVHRLAVCERAWGERTSVAHRSPGGEIAAPLEQLARILEGFEHGRDVHARMAAAWEPAHTFAGAFARGLGGLFDEAGLLVLDPRTPELAALAAPLHRWALHAANDIEQGLHRRAAELESAARPVQVPLRSGACLTFVHPDGAEGPRFRAEASGSGSGSSQDWRVGDRTVEASTLEGWLESEPLRFSTSALLRPLLQDTCLPTAAYVGGPAEVAYFEQLEPLYAMRGLPMPLVVRRASWRWLPRTVADTLSACSLGSADLAEGVDKALAKLGAAEGPGPSGDVAAARLMAAVDQVLASLDGELAPLGEPVVRAGRKTRGTFARYAGRYAARIDAARGRLDGARLAELRRAHGWLFPHGRPQERTLGFASFAAQVGWHAFAARALEAAGQSGVAEQPGVREGAVVTAETCDLLAIGPHPDDVELFCGGTVALTVQQGYRVAILDLTRGELASRGTPEARELEAAEGARRLGVAVRLNLGLRDGAVGDDAPSVDALVDALRQLRPSIVLAPWAEERHPDHRAAHALVRRAAFLAGLLRFRANTGLAVHRPAQIAFYPMRVVPTRPSFLVDISAVAAVKHQAIAAHVSQVAPTPGGAPTLIGSAGALAALDSLDRYWGAHLGVERAEAFMTEAAVPVDDLVAHFRARPEPHLMVEPT